MPVNQLTLREHLSIIENTISNIELNNPQFKLGLALRFLYKTIAILNHLSRNGTKIKKLNISKNEAMQLKAKQLIQDEIEC